MCYIYIVETYYFRIRIKFNCVYFNVYKMLHERDIQGGKSVDTLVRNSKQIASKLMY